VSQQCWQAGYLNVFVCALKAFAIACHENTEREKYRIFGGGLSRTSEEILRHSYLDERKLRKHCRYKGGSDTGMREEAAGRKGRGRTALIMERKHWMIFSAVVGKKSY
jgi:hypothetical protein